MKTIASVSALQSDPGKGKGRNTKWCIGLAKKHLYFQLVTEYMFPWQCFLRLVKKEKTCFIKGDYI